MSSDEGLVVHGLRIGFGGPDVLRSVDLNVRRGDICALLGPSGCGKTTLLRVVAGLERPDGGSISWQGSDLLALPVHRRPIGLMFQDHALFPHRNVGNNVGFGLAVAGTAPDVRTRRVAELLELVGLGGTESRSVMSLSGGEAQRVALARALAPEPELLLLDEPLGSLDRALRERLGEEMRNVVKALGVTAIHVTHDHDEAFSVADRLAVMDEGEILQTGPPLVVRERPSDARVARFLGLDNVLEPATARRLGLAVDTAVVIDPLAIEVGPTAGGVVAVVTGSHYRTGRYIVTCDIGGDTVFGSASERPDVGDEVGLSVDAGEVIRLRGPRGR